MVLVPPGLTLVFVDGVVVTAGGVTIAEFAGVVLAFVLAGGNV